MIKVSKILTAVINTISTQDATDKGMFGPVHHGTTEDTHSKIKEEGFQIIEGERGEEGISNGYQIADYANGIPPPVHHLGYGAYFTTVKNIAKGFGGGSMKGVKTYFLDVHNVETINFGSPNTMMKWWVANGYDPELAKKDRVAATKKLTETLKSKYDAVWFKGKGLRKLLDGDQIIVFDPSKVYMVDDSVLAPMSINSKVQRKSDGVIGVIRRKTPMTADQIEHQLKFWETVPEDDERRQRFHVPSRDTKFRLEVKWPKGPSDLNVFDTDVVPYEKKQKAASSFVIRLT